MQRTASKSSPPFRGGAPLVLVVLILGLATLGAPAGEAAPMREPVPDVLAQVESSAEDIVDFALAGDRSKVVAGAHALRSEAAGPAAAALRRSGASAAEVTSLRQRATHLVQLSEDGSFVAVALGANAVSGLMPALYAHFRSPVPPMVLRLDYLDREAQLRSLAHQPKGVAAAIEGLRQTWPRLRPKVVAAGGANEAAAFDRHVSEMSRLAPGARREIQAEAINGLQLVDELEQVFL